MYTGILALVLCVLGFGLGRHIARYLGIYLMLGMASLLPLFIYLSIPSISEQSPASYLFINLLGEEQSANANIHLMAIAGGLVSGFLWQMLRGGDDER
ncbi:MAG: hypothetical protein ABJK25_06030 [Halieaceae bacterium]